MSTQNVPTILHRHFIWRPPISFLTYGLCNHPRFSAIQKKCENITLRKVEHGLETYINWLAFHLVFNLAKAWSAPPLLYLGQENNLGSQPGVRTMGSTVSNVNQQNDVLSSLVLSRPDIEWEDTNQLSYMRKLIQMIGDTSWLLSSLSTSHENVRNSPLNPFPHKMHMYFHRLNW